MIYKNQQARREGGQGGQMPRGPANFRGPAEPTVNIVNMRYERALYKRALYERARDRSAQGPVFSLGGPENQESACTFK